MAHDPVWAVGWVKRAVKVFAALCFLLLALWVVWLLLPEAPASIELQLTTNTDATVAGRELGRGDLILDDATLRTAGTVVPENTDLPEIMSQMYPDMEFRGLFMIEPESMPRATDGYECYLRRNAAWLIVRVWVFVIEDDQWLAVPIQFRDSRGRVHTTCDDSGGYLGVTVTKHFTKRRTHSVNANVLAIDGDFPGEDEIRVGPFDVR